MKYYDFEAKTKELLVNCQSDLLEDCKRLFNSGGIEPEEFGNDYLLPKIIFYVALKRQADLFKPSNKLYLKDCKNLECF